MDETDNRTRRGWSAYRLSITLLIKSTITVGHASAVNEVISRMDFCVTRCFDRCLSTVNPRWAHVYASTLYSMMFSVDDELHDLALTIIPDSRLSAVFVLILSIDECCDCVCKEHRYDERGSDWRAFLDGNRIINKCSTLLSLDMCTYTL